MQGQNPPSERKLFDSRELAGPPLSTGGPPWGDAVRQNQKYSWYRDCLSGITYRALYPPRCGATMIACTLDLRFMNSPWLLRRPTVASGMYGINMGYEGISDMTGATGFLTLACLGMMGAWIGLSESSTGRLGIYGHIFSMDSTVE